MRENSNGFLCAWVRVLGIRQKRFVEFEFALGAPQLAVELIMPLGVFEEFCRAQGARVKAPDEVTAVELQALAWREHQPGLLQRIGSMTS
jgi:phenol hydroxylase P0 protein